MEPSPGCPISRLSTCALCPQLLAGAKINELTKHRQTALHLAAQQDLATICSVLLENGVDFPAEDENGNNGKGGRRPEPGSGGGGGPAHGCLSSRLSAAPGCDAGAPQQRQSPSHRVQRRRRGLQSQVLRCSGVGRAAVTPQGVAGAET